MDKEKGIAPINEDLKEEIYETELIKQKIYTIRGKQVMLDSDVAMLYKTETKYINRTVKRNIDRFPEEFCFQLKENEMQSCGAKLAPHEKRNKSILPYVYTEQGIAMLSALLKSDVAVKTSVKIMKAFIEMRNFLMRNSYILERLTKIENKNLEYDSKFEKVFNLLGQEDNLKQRIFFKGQIWDSYSLIVDLIKKAKEKIVIIDNYVDDSILNMLSKKNKNVEVVILTSEKGKITKLDVQKFNKEYPVLKLAKTNKFHDRFIIIDNKELFHLRSIYKRFGK